MKKKTKKQFTRADGVSVFGFFLYFGLTWLGFLLMFDLPMSFIFASLSTALSWGLLSLLKYLKGVEEDIKAWRTREYVILGVTFCMFIFLTNRPMDWAFSTALVNNSNIQEAAKNDVEKMKQLFEDYERREEEYIVTTKTALEQNYLYKRNKAFRDCVQARFDKTDNLQQQDIDQYINGCYKQFLGKGISEDETNNYDDFKKEYEERIEKIDVAVAGFNFFQITGLALNVSKLNIANSGKEIAETLTNFSAYSVDGMPFIFDKEGKPLRDTYEFESEFKKELEPMLSYNPKSLLKMPIPVLLSLIVNLIMLFGYFLAYRSAKVEISRRNRKNIKSIKEGTRILD